MGAYVNLAKCVSNKMHKDTIQNPFLSLKMMKNDKKAYLLRSKI